MSRDRGAPAGLYFSVHADINLEDEAWQETLLRDAKAFGIKAVILDPIHRYSPNVDKGPAEVWAVTQPLRRLAIEAECTIIVIHRRVSSFFPGLTDWFAACEAPIHLEPAGKDAGLVVPEGYKFSHHPESLVFRIEGKSEEPVVRLRAEAASVKDARRWQSKRRSATTSRSTLDEARIRSSRALQFAV